VIDEDDTHALGFGAIARRDYEPLVGKLLEPPLLLAGYEPPTMNRRAKLYFALREARRRVSQAWAILRHGEARY
jgi:hypothetical protein